MTNLEISQRLKAIERSLNTHSSRVGQRLAALESAAAQQPSDEELREELLVAKQQLALKEAYLQGLLEGIALMKQ